MDDSLERPTSHVPKTSLEDKPAEDDEQTSEDEEDAGPDWTKLIPSASRPVIPKRGEKEFEPAPGGGSGLQMHVLDRARNAMSNALRATRSQSNKSISYTVWHVGIARAHVVLARGIHFTSMGHSASRPIRDSDDTEKYQKRLELLPEEAIYLIERGSVFCWKETDLDLSKIDSIEEINGVPMTVQQAYSVMIGKENLTLERFQVYAYLKRLGYVVTRTVPPNSMYPIPPPRQLKPGSTILQGLSTTFSSWISRLLRIFTGDINWWRPLRISCWFSHDKTYASVFRSLRFLPSGHDVPLHMPESAETANGPSPYEYFYNVYKPSTPYRKSAPGQPDYQIAVINARTTPMPSLRELTDLFDVSPELPPPVPRQRRPTPDPKVGFPAAQPTISSPSRPTPSLFLRTFGWLLPRSQPPEPLRRPNPFMALKAGRKITVIAVVDSGSISFFRFGQGTFTDWPMI